MSSAPTEKPQDPKSARRPQAPETLLPATIQWLASLPPDIRPHHLPSEHTRIANALARVWDKPESCLPCLEDLLTDRRGDRQGFSLSIAMELAGLKDHYETNIRVVPQTCWDLIGALPLH